MKYVNWLKSTVLLVVLVTMVSCEKERIESEKKDTEYTSLDEFYNNNQPEEQVFIIDSTDADTIVGKEGTQIWGIPKNIFMYKSNYQDIVYPYELRLIEAYSMKNMIFSKLPTLAQGTILSTGGEIKVTAYKNNQELVIKEHMGYRMMAPQANPKSNMNIFYGFTAATTNDWNDSLIQTDYLFNQDDVSSLVVAPSGYLMTIAKLGWICPAKKQVAASQTQITFTAPGVNTQFIDIYAILPDQHSLMKVNQMTLSDMPVGETMKVFSMGKDTHGKMHYFLQTYTISAQMTVDVVMQESTEAEVLSVMATL